MATPLAELDVRVSLTDALSDLIADYDVSGHSPRTTALFSTHISHMIEMLAPDGVTTLDEVTPAHVTRFLALGKARGLKPASLHVQLRTIRRFFSWSIAQDYLDRNPASKVSAPRVVVEPVRFMSDQQLDDLLASIKADKSVEGVRDGAFIRVLRDTGIRRSELVGLTVDCVDLEQRTLVIKAATSKARKGRTVPVSKDTGTHLRAYLRVRTAYLTRMKRQDTGALWVASKGDLSGNGALQALWRRCAAAGLPRFSLHSLRHRMAALAIQDGLPMPYLVRIGGWANAEMPSNRYGQFAIEERAIDAMQALLDR